MAWLRTMSALIVIAAAAEARAQSLEGPVYDLSAGEPITRTSITLRWTSVYETNLLGTSYHGRFSEHNPGTTSIDLWWSTAMSLSNLPTADFSGEDEVYEATGLLPGRTYYFVVKAVDSNGIEGLEYSEPASATTDPDTVSPGAPTSPSGSTLGGGEVRFRWTASGDDGALGSAIQYEIRFSPSTDTADPEDWWAGADLVPEPPYPAESGTSQHMDIGGLVPRQAYTLGIRSFDPGDNSSPIAFAMGIAAGAIEPDSPGEDSRGCAHSAGRHRGLEFALALAAILACRRNHFRSKARNSLSLT